MADLKAVNAEDLERELRDAAQRATARISELAELAISDVRTVAAAQHQLAPMNANELMVLSRVAMVQDVDTSIAGTVRELGVSVSLRCEYGDPGGTMRSERLAIPPGRYRLLVFLVDQVRGENGAPTATPAPTVIDLNDDPLRGEDQDRDDDQDDDE